jgi:hypothetical protein
MTTASTNPKETTVTNPAPNTTLEASQTAETDPATAVGADATTDPVETGEGADAAALRREAANYRTRLRDTEAERDRLAATVATFQRAAVEKLAASGDGKKLAAGADLWVAGVKVEDLLAEDGTVDAAKVSAAVEGVLADHPNWGPTRVRVPRDMGQGQRESAAGPVRSMQQILRGA